MRSGNHRIRHFWRIMLLLTVFPESNRIERRTSGSHLIVNKIVYKSSKIVYFINIFRIFCQTFCIYFCIFVIFFVYFYVHIIYFCIFFCTYYIFFVYMIVHTIFDKQYVQQNIHFFLYIYKKQRKSHIFFVYIQKILYILTL